MSKSRFLSIDLIKILSCYAVIIVHSGDENWGVPISESALQFRLFFYFGVPFFLAVSFYLIVSKSQEVYTWKFWRSKIERLMVPYAIWSAIFLLFRIAIFVLSRNTERLASFTSEPLSIIFTGGASYQLYYLPLLFVGTLLCLLIPWLNKLKPNNLWIPFIATLSIILYDWLVTSGNNFQLKEPSLAFQSWIEYFHLDLQHQPVLRIISIFFAWAIRCLPYLAIALTLRNWRVVEKLSNAHTIVAIGWAIFSIVSNTIGRQILPSAYTELLLGFTLLLFSFSISRYFTNDCLNTFIAKGSKYSFGIYLIHPFAMYLSKFAVGKAFPMLVDRVSIQSILSLSFVCFVLSWGCVDILSQPKSMSKYLFGI